MKITFLLADEVRAEATGKHTVLGLFPDNKVIVQITPEPEGTPESIPRGIERLVFLVNVSKVPEGEYRFRGQFLFPSQEPMGPQLQLGEANIKTGRSHTVLLETKPFIVTTPGEYKLIFWVNDEEHVLPFEIEFQPQPSSAS